MAVTREGILFSNQRARLAACAPPQLSMLTAKEDAFLTSLLNSPNPDRVAQGRLVQQAVEDLFKEKKAAELAALDEVAAQGLGTGLTLARGMGVSNEAIAEGRVRLTDLRSALHDDELRDLLARTPDPLDPERQRTLDLDLLMAP